MRKKNIVHNALKKIRFRQVPPLIISCAGPYPVMYFLNGEINDEDIKRNTDDPAFAC